MTTTAVTSSNSQLDCQNAVGCMGTILSSEFPEGQEGKTPLDSETKGQWDVAIVFRRWCVTTGCVTRQLGANSPVTPRLGHLQLAFHCKSKPRRQISALLLSESGKATAFLTPQSVCRAPSTAWFWLSGSTMRPGEAAQAWRVFEAAAGKIPLMKGIEEARHDDEVHFFSHTHERMHTNTGTQACRHFRQVSADCHV